MNKFISFLTILGFLSLIAACKSTSSTAKNNQTAAPNPYQALGADVFVYHFSEDSSAIFCSIESKELLYARKLGTTAYTSLVSVKYNLFKMEGSAKIFVDSATTYFKDIVSKERTRSVFRTNFRLEPGKYNIEVKLTDLQRKSEFESFIFADKTSKTNEQNFLILDASTNLAMSPRKISMGDSIRIESARNRSRNKLNLFLFTSDIKLPPAPFSIANPEIPNPMEAIKKELDFKEGVAHLQVYGYLQMLSFREMADTGFAFASFSKVYPNVKKKSDLHPPLRYLTTKQEFETISKAKNPKEKVDLFWIECGGNKDRARGLVAEYYQRVQIANKFFTCYTEGWRTDRGMIYLVFGEPTKINTSATQQTWIYGDDSNGTALKFVFTKVNSIWSDNVFMLRRDPMFKTHWERMVTTWRNGRIYLN
jgi:GWxTD domain-containing protein